MMYKELQGVVSGIAGSVFSPGRDIEVISRLNGLPGTIDISLSSALDHKNRIGLFLMGVDWSLGTGCDFDQTDTGHIGFLTGDKNSGLDIIVSRVLGEYHFSLGKKFGLHGISPYRRILEYNRAEYVSGLHEKYIGRNYFTS